MGSPPPLLAAPFEPKARTLQTWLKVVFQKLTNRQYLSYLILSYLILSYLDWEMGSVPQEIQFYRGNTSSPAGDLQLP